MMKKIWGGGKSNDSTPRAEGTAVTSKQQAKLRAFNLSPAPKSGALGNLTAEQTRAYNKFCSQCPAAQGVAALCPAATDAAYADAERHQFAANAAQAAAADSCAPVGVTEGAAFILRFLRARDFDVSRACTMLCAYLQWYRGAQVRLLCREVRFPWVEQLREIYPHGYHGVDRSGRPIYIERVGKADVAKALELAPLDLLIAYWVQQYEYLRTVILPCCSIAAGRRIEQFVSIIDLSSFSLTSLKQHKIRTILKRLAAVSQNYFPEMLGCMILVNAPSMFGPVWSFARSLVDQGTVDKITLMTTRSTHWKEYLQLLAEPSQLPQFLGGTSPDSRWTRSPLGPWTDSAVRARVGQRHGYFVDAQLNLLDLNLAQGDAATVKKYSESLKAGGGASVGLAPGGAAGDDDASGGGDDFEFDAENNPLDCDASSDSGGTNRP